MLAQRPSGSSRQRARAWQRPTTEPVPAAAAVPPGVELAGPKRAPRQRPAPLLAFDIYGVSLCKRFFFGARSSSESTGKWSTVHVFQRAATPEERAQGEKENSFLPVRFAPTGIEGPDRDAVLREAEAYVRRLPAEASTS